MKNIVVYGLGDLGRKIAKELKDRQNKNQFRIVAFMDKRDLNAQFEFTVLKPENLKHLQYDNICITSEKWFADISEELQHKYGVSRDKIIHFKQLINDENYYCNLCNAKVPFLLEFGVDSPVFSKRKIIGGGVRKNCLCPVCGGKDRERWLKYVLDNKINLLDESVTVLHFAPEKLIENIFRNKRKLKYITADIEAGRADKVEDITHISFPDRYFDYIICNHVLEHVKDENSVFMELKRCLKEKGKVIFSVPICWEINTFEDDSIITSEDRVREYGQEDHVRLYGKDLKTRLEKFGFRVEYYQVDKVLSEEEIEMMGLIPEDTIWILTL